MSKRNGVDGHPYLIPGLGGEIFQCITTEYEVAVLGVFFCLFLKILFVL